MDATWKKIKNKSTFHSDEFNTKRKNERVRQNDNLEKVLFDYTFQSFSNIVKGNCRGDQKFCGGNFFTSWREPENLSMEH